MRARSVSWSNDLLSADDLLSFSSCCWASWLGSLKLRLYPEQRRGLITKLVLCCLCALNELLLWSKPVGLPSSLNDNTDELLEVSENVEILDMDCLSTCCS